MRNATRAGTIFSRTTKAALSAILSAAVVCPSALGQSAGQPQATQPGSTDVLEVYQRLFRQHDFTLADPFFEGRAPGTRGNELAAEYVEFNFKKFGLTPAFPVEGVDAAGQKASLPMSSFRQPFQLGTQKKVLKQDGSWAGAGGSGGALKPGEQFTALPWSASGEATAPLAFAGYAIANGTDEYTSYPDGTDLKGKAVMVLRFEPMTDAGKSKWRDERWSSAADLDPKIGSAIKRGAAMVILVSPPGADDDRVGTLETMDSIPARSGVQKAPVIMMSTEQADALVRAGDASGRSLLDLRKLVDTKGEVVDLSKVTVTVKTEVDRSPIMTDNVGGILKGKGALADEYIVIGAHFDHVGYGLFGSRDPNGRGKLHPGADDNASGSAGMLTLAERLSKAYAALPHDANCRSIFFMGFTGEESGLNGSRHYTKNMIVDKSKHYFMLNLDMIGRLNAKQELEVSGVGTADGLEEWVKPYLNNSGMTVASKPGGTGPSDHASFFAAGVPVLFFFTGLHDQYHMPTDTPDLINAEGAGKTIDLAYRIAFDMAQRPGAFPYVADPRDRTKGGAGDQASGEAKDSPGPVAVGVRFGITPGDYNDSKSGVLIGDVAKGWSADKAGLKAGDRLLKWNDKEIDTVESWMPMLSACKPGDKITVTYERDGKPQTTEVTMMARDSGVK